MKNPLANLYTTTAKKILNWLLIRLKSQFTLKTTVSSFSTKKLATGCALRVKTLISPSEKAATDARETKTIGLAKIK
jgi:hypothetical protein